MSFWTYQSIWWPVNTITVFCSAYGGSAVQRQFILSLLSRHLSVECIVVERFQVGCVAVEDWGCLSLPLESLVKHPDMSSIHFHPTCHRGFCNYYYYYYLNVFCCCWERKELSLYQHARSEHLFPNTSFTETRPLSSVPVWALTCHAGL